MFDLILDLKDFLVDLLNNENYIDIFSILLASFASYQVAKYNTSKPNKLKIKQQQFEQLYLPLHRLLEDFSFNISEEDINNYRERIGEILDHHYPLAYPQLHKLNAELVQSLNSNDFATAKKLLNIIKHQIDIDYDLLKKVLGYPSESYIGIFRRMTPKQKCLFLNGYLNLFLLFSPFALMIIFGSTLEEHMYLFFVMILSAFLINIWIALKISDAIRSMKD